jgi:hypothetical protein
LALPSIPVGIRVSQSIHTGSVRSVDLATRHVPQPNPTLAHLEAVLRDAVRSIDGLTRR